MSVLFPGMDPYLEGPLVWPDVHASFIVYLREHLRPLLRPRYLIAVESRVFVEGSDTALPQKAVLRLIYCRFNALKFTIVSSILTFEAKPV